MKILSTAPSRISLIGGGSDVEPYVSQRGGAVLNMAINLRQKVLIRTDDDIFEGPNSFPYDADPRLAYAILDYFKMGGMHATALETSFDGLIAAGLGSSGAFSVALVGGLLKSQGKTIYRDLVAETAWDIEVNQLGWYGGRQDQYAAAFGGVNFITFGNKVNVIPAERKHGDSLRRFLLLVYIGGKRESRKIQQSFKKLDDIKILQLDRIKDLAVRGAEALVAGDMELVGHLIDEGFKLKKQSNKKVSNERIDDIYNYAKESGAMGGKIIGAGGAGYMIFFVNPIDREKLISKLKEKGIEEVDFSIDYNGLETRIL
mgnify:CR=1 FL=1